MVLVSFFFIIILIFHTSCQKYGLEIIKIKVSKESLPSTFAKSPDPLQNSPPRGEKLYIGWKLNPSHSIDHTRLYLSLVFNNLETMVVDYDITTFEGYRVYELLREEFDKKKGILTYKAELFRKEKLVMEYKQNVYFQKIVKPAFPQKAHKLE